jgi:translation initiation factor IF-2
MQSRLPRLGDIVDDYCPRERRLTNHAVVAMVGDDIKQTRCSTCDAEHEYKHAKVPTQRKKKSGTGALYDEVLAGGPAKLSAPVPAPPAPPAPRPATDEAREDGDEPVLAAAAAPEAAPVEEPPVADAGGETRPAGDEVDGPVHRQLIRATLPRVEGQAKEQRPIPEFTARTAQMRHGRFRPQGGGQGQSRGGGGQAPGQNGKAAPGNRFGGRRGPGQVAAGGAPGNRPPGGPGAQGDRQGRRRRGGRPGGSK